MTQWRDAVYNESLFLSALHGARKRLDIADINQQLIDDNKSYRCRGVTNERFKYFVYNEHDPVIEELYDMEKDPSEMNNLVDSPEYAAVLEKLRNQTEELHSEIIVDRAEATTVMKPPAQAKNPVTKAKQPTASKKHPVMNSFVLPGASVNVETASTAEGFKQLLPGAKTRAKVTVNQKTSNDPLKSLNDGMLAEEIGPVFANGIWDGAYKLDLGAVKPVMAITTWSYNVKGVRGAQKLTLYGSDSHSDPGWNLTAYKALCTIDTRATKDKFVATALQAPDGKNLGSYRWIVWAVSPISNAGGGENTAFQEFAVETH